jgi:putative permease
MNILKPKNPLLQSISSWMARTFADPGASSLFFTIIIVLLMVHFFGQILTPILVSVAIAYMLSGLIEMLTRRGFPKGLAFGLLYGLFLALIVGIIAVLIPMLIKQTTNMINELPNAIEKFRAWLDTLSHTYPKLVGPTLVTNVNASLQSQLGNAGKTILSFSVSSLGGLITVGLYVLLVPLMVFFFLKDKKQLLGTLSEMLPKNRSVLIAVSTEVNYKIGQYIRGRVIEIVIISIVSMITFVCFGLQYAVLLGVIVGLSVIIPYVGAVIAALPVAMISLLQWGFSWECAALNMAFWIIIAIDANILVPLLFAGVLDLSPAAIILSVLFFGDIWGFWGVFLSIPLASVVKAIWTAWPSSN